MIVAKKRMTHFDPPTYETKKRGDRSAPKKRWVTHTIFSFGLRSKS